MLNCLCHEKKAVHMKISGLIQPNELSFGHSLTSTLRMVLFNLRGKTNSWILSYDQICPSKIPFNLINWISSFPVHRYYSMSLEKLSESYKLSIAAKLPAGPPRWQNGSSSALKCSLFQKVVKTSIPNTFLRIILLRISQQT